MDVQILVCEVPVHGDPFCLFCICGSDSILLLEAAYLSHFQQSLAAVGPDLRLL